MNTSWHRRSWAAYVLAVLLPVATLLGRLFADYRPGDAPMIILFVLSAIICAYVGGLGPGLAATIVSATIADYFLLRPSGGVAFVAGLHSPQWWVLLAVGGLISVLAEALHRNERRFRALTEHGSDCVVLTDAKTNIVYLSPSVEAVEGFTPQELIGRSGMENTHPDDVPLIKEAVTQIVARPGRSVPILWRRRHKDGRWLWLEGVATNLLADPAVRAIVTNYRDVTARKVAVEELRWRIALFEALLDSTIDGVLVVDGAGQKVLQNQRLVELWRIPREIAEDKDDARQLEYCANHTKNRGQFLEKIHHLYSHPDETSRDEIELVDGTVLDRTSAPVRDKEGRYFGRIWAFRDITERKRLEEQFRQSQKMDMLGQLSGGIAHDFNNILTAIIGHLGLLQGNAQVTPEVVGSLREIEAAANRAARLTSQLLMFSRQQVISVSTLDVNEVVANLVKMLARVLGEQVALQLECATEPLFFAGDAGMIEQVLVNLAVNARDAMPDGGVLRIATRGEQRTSESGVSQWVRLSVSDSGTGIPAEIRSRIFEPFFTTKDVGKGTGLGLATVLSIVQQHHGWIDVESEEGRGSTFHIFLPRVSRGPGETKPETKVAPAAGRNELLLVVEDEAAIRQIVTHALQRHGYRVLAAGSGREALELWRQRTEEIALLLTDMVMPEGISGTQLAQQLQTEQPALTVVFTSGYRPDNNAGRDVALVSGVNYLPKPYELAALLSIVRTALDRRD